MLTAFKKIIGYIKYLILCVVYNVRSSVSNRKSFIIQTVTMFINNFVFILFWLVIFNNKGGSINGTTITDIIYLWSIPTIGYGICFFCFGGVDVLGQDIAEGNLDIYLTKPKHTLISQLTSRAILSAMGDLLFGAFCGLVAVNFNPLKFIAVLALGVVSGIILVCVMTSMQLLSFWLGDLTQVTRRYTHSLVITLTLYPENMFPKIIKIAMYTVIPAGYIAHMPIKIITGNLPLLGVLLLVMMFAIAIMLELYNKGLKKYESGNSVTRR